MHPPLNFEVNEWWYGLRTQWRQLLRTSKSPAAATTALYKAHRPSLIEDPERAIFWLMLAHYQCEDRCLQPIVRRRAVAIIRRGADRVLWLDTSPGTPRRRLADFDRLLAQIKKQKPKRQRRARQPRT